GHVERRPHLYITSSRLTPDSWPSFETPAARAPQDEAERASNAVTDAFPAISVAPAHSAASARSAVRPRARARSPRSGIATAVPSDRLWPPRSPASPAAGISA